MTWVFSALITWIVLWLINIQLAKIEANRFINLLVPALFGFSILILWEGFVRGFNVSPILLPPPSAIAVRFSGSLSILWIDFVQTFIKGALSGYVIGCIAAFITAVAVDKSNFLKRGLLPVGNFVAALPIIGMAPILVTAGKVCLGFSLDVVYFLQLAMRRWQCHGRRWPFISSVNVSSARTSALACSLCFPIIISSSVVGYITLELKSPNMYRHFETLLSCSRQKACAHS